VVLRSILSPLTIAAARRHFRRLRRAGLFVTDEEQVVGLRAGLYSELSSLHWQAQLAPLLNELVPSRAEPSYTFVMRYAAGAVLKRHTDRPQCKWNVSFCIDMEPRDAPQDAWPFFLDVDGRVVEVRLGVGDAVVYSGTDTPHWRDALGPGRAVWMCFFHYVDASFEGTRD
jgi:hypothetical protein